MTVTVFFLMVALYVLVLHPKNKDKLESQRDIPIDDDDDRFETEERHE
jgi:hypothetical protein